MEEAPSVSNELLKVDRREHVRVPRVWLEALLDEFERRGVSAAEFAAHSGVKHSTVCHWKRRRDLDRIRQTVEEEETEAAASKAVWLEAVADAQVVSVEDGLGKSSHR